MKTILKFTLALLIGLCLSLSDLPDEERDLTTPNIAYDATNIPYKYLGKGGRDYLRESGQLVIKRKPNLQEKQK